MDIQEIKKDVIKMLKPLEPFEVILFGSYAKGNPSVESDIDLYVVTKDDFIPANFTEQNKIYLRVSKSIRDIRSKMPVDLIVHTKKMNEKFAQMNSSFYRQIVSEGERLI